MTPRGEQWTRVALRLGLLLGGVVVAWGAYEAATAAAAYAADRPPAASGAAVDLPTDVRHPPHPAKKPHKATARPTPPGQAKNRTTPPGQVKNRTTPPGQAKNRTTPPGQAKNRTTPPGQAKNRAKSPPDPGQIGEDAPTPVDDVLSQPVRSGAPSPATHAPRPVTEPVRAGLSPKHAGTRHATTANRHAVAALCSPPPLDRSDGPRPLRSDASSAPVTPVHRSSGSASSAPSGAAHGDSADASAIAWAQPTLSGHPCRPTGGGALPSRSPRPGTRPT
ncbi:hypothetical protein [Micromonospora sp. SL4-19]|uniref:hypothetical protein n=1 Tax=Micromonospora sp. SL4-19 TaxID=3399129 RepID=UPI003A4E54D9